MAYDFSAGVSRGIDYTNVYNPASGPVSGCAWVYSTTLNSTDQYILNVNDGSGTRTYTFVAIASVTVGGIQWQVVTSGTALSVRSTAAALTANAWTHVGFYWDGSLTGANVVLYVNGSSVATTVNADGTGTAVAGTGAWRVSGRSSDSTRGIIGRAAHPAWWNRQLTADEWAALGKGYDPMCFQRGLQFSPELIRGTQDRITGQAGTLANAPTVIEHPSLFLLSDQDEDANDYAAAAAGGTWRGGLLSSQHFRLVA